MLRGSEAVGHLLVPLWLKISGLFWRAVRSHTQVQVLNRGMVVYNIEPDFGDSDS